MPIGHTARQCPYCKGNVFKQTQPDQQSGQTVTQQQNPKAMEIPDDTPIQLHMDFVKDFSDQDELNDFIESLSEHELSIIERCKNDPNKLRELRKLVCEDIESTAKDLAMDD